MSEQKVKEREAATEQLAAVRAKLHATGATVLSPTAEWLALKKEMQLLVRKLK